MDADIERTIREAIARQPALAAECRAVFVELHPDVVLLDGTVETIAAKRRLALLVGQSTGGLGLLDRVRVERAETRDDVDVARDLLDALMREPIFRGYRVVEIAGDTLELPPAENEAGDTVIGAAVRDSTVALAGTVGSLTHRRFAEVLAWWTPGTGDVDNRLYVTPSEKDSDEEITDAVSMALEKDPWIDAAGIDVRTNGREVHLAGTLPSAEQRRMAEYDAWYVRGVHAVTNDIEIDG
ncbi:MAG: BON domain-containing protein [Gammaproteobacteria bacterium]|nr:BON domain-containing protein [Gammaproteobacteria bacterium]